MSTLKAGQCLVVLRITIHTEIRRKGVVSWSRVVKAGPFFPRESGRLVECACSISLVVGKDVFGISGEAVLLDVVAGARGLLDSLESRAGQVEGSEFGVGKLGTEKSSVFGF